MSSDINLRFLNKLADGLFEPPRERERFLNSFLQKEFVTEKAIVWTGEPPEVRPFEILESWPEQPTYVDRVSEGAQPGKHKLHDAGAYYCLDYSSVFATVPLREVQISRPVVLDVCASPGGKSILASRQLVPSFLAANEVIAKRSGALISNLKRLKFENVGVLQMDPAKLEATFTGSFDVVLVDAPCSGQSLILKGQKAPGCFNPVQIKHNQKRQKRILAHSSGTVSSGGFMLYTTCTFSPEENEEVGEWFLRKFSEFQPVTVPSLSEFQSHLVGWPCYRLFPQSGRGAGSFAMLMKRQGEREPKDLGELDAVPWRWRS